MPVGLKYEGDNNMRIPNKIDIANLPTRIEKLDRLSEKLGKNIYIKRDDMTGTEFSGNKIRKLEYSVKEALDNGCDMLITCGGIQSNHARATAALAARLGIKSHLVLRKTENDVDIYDGNYFLDRILGAGVKFISAEEYSKNRYEIMNKLKEELEGEGYKPYIIPEGASNGIGTFGYFNAMKEIIDSQSVMGVHFDAIVVATGSGGTYSGLYLGNELFDNKAKIYGVNVCNDANYFLKKIKSVIEESLEYMDIDEVNLKNISILDGYVGRGYALSRKEELNFIENLARLEGIILDPVYTGKAMRGLVEEIEKGRLNDSENILFIHTGGLFGAFPKKDLFL